MLAARVERHLRAETRLLAGDDNLRGNGAVVERPQHAAETLLGKLANWTGNGEVSSREFKTHGRVLIEHLSLI
jgi:hypothetical protein